MSISLPPPVDVLPPPKAPLARHSSELQLRAHARKLAQEMPPVSDVGLILACALGAALHFTLQRILAPHSFLAAHRWLPLPMSPAHSVWLTVMLGAVYGAVVWLVIVQLCLPIYRLHVRRRKIWPLSCEAIRVSEHKERWEAWAAGIDANLDAATLAEEWGGMGGAPALRLMESYQESFNQVGGTHFAGAPQFVCLRFFPTPPPAQHSSWAAYFRRTRPAQPTATTPMQQATPFTPYEDLAQLATPAPGPSPSGAHGAAAAAADDTMALVFLTILPQHNLRPYLPACVAAPLSVFMRAYHWICGVRSAASSIPAAEFDPEGRLLDVRPSLSMSLGVIGFQFPFRSGIFFTRSLAEYAPFSSAFAKHDNSIRVADSGNEGNTLEADTVAFRARAARTALILQVLTEWNLARSVKTRVDLLLHPTPTSSSAVASARRVRGMLSVPLPPTHIADLRAHRGADWREYAESNRLTHTGLQESRFARVNGSIEFAPDPNLAETMAQLFQNVAAKQAATGSSHPTLIQPTASWIRAVLSTGSYDSQHQFIPLAHALQLRQQGDLAACSLVSEFGPSLLTSDVAGFNYSLVDKSHANLYALKLAAVTRRALARGVGFVDVGPTTGELKRAIGYQEVPMYGAVICAQPHMLWLARAAAGMVALTQFSNTTEIAHMIVDRVRGMFGIQTKSESDASSAAGKTNAEGVIQGCPVPLHVRERNAAASRRAWAARIARKAAHRAAMSSGAPCNRAAIDAAVASAAAHSEVTTEQALCEIQIQNANSPHIYK